MKGLGAALLQDGCPVVFASKVLTPTEQCYANIEHELLACVFGAEQFCTYVFSHMVHNREQPQTPWADYAQEPGRCTHPPPENAVMPPGLWHLHQILTWQRDAHSRCPIPLCPTCFPCNTSRHHCKPSPHHTTEEDWFPGCCTRWPNPLCPSRDDPLRLAWRYTRCSHGCLPIPPCLWCPSSGRWHHSTLWSSCHPPSERDKVLQSIHVGHQGISKCQYHACQCVYWPGINQDIKHAVEACATCQCHHPQEHPQPPKPTPAPECPWQHLGADFMHFDGNKYLIIIDYYSKMPFVCKIPPSQCNATKMISILKELFAQHGIPESLCSDNGPQFASALFAEFLTDWNFDHCTSAPTNPCSNGQAEAAVKIVKGLLTWSKYSVQDPYLALLAYHSTPWMHTCAHLVRCSSSMPCTQQCHNISTILTHMLLLTVTI